MRRAARQKRTADPGPASKSPDSKRPSLGDMSMDDRRQEQQRKLAEFRERKKQKNEEKKLARPAWKPAGSASGQRITRSMTRRVVSTSCLPNVRSANTSANTSNASLPVPKQQKSSTIAEQRDDLTTSTPVADVQTVGSLKVLDNVKSTLLEDPTRITPVANRLQMIDIETDVLDGLNIQHWKKLYDEFFFKLKMWQNKFEKLTPTDDVFWQVERDRAIGEVGFFLGKKSKFTQFGAMIQDPHGEKFKVQSIDDISGFWTGMVLPSIEDFVSRAEWLTIASKNGWTESDKEAKPKKVSHSPQRPNQKENRNPKVVIDPEADAEKAKKKLKAKKDAEDRRKQMRAMMAARKKAMSTSDLPNQLEML